MTRTFSTIVADLLISPFTIAFYTCTTWARCVLHLHDVGQVCSTPARRAPGAFYTCTTCARCVLHLHDVGQVRSTPARRAPGAFYTCTTWARCVLHLQHVGQVRSTPARRGPGAFCTCTTWARSSTTEPLCLSLMMMQLYASWNLHSHTHPSNSPFVRDYPGEPVPER